MPDPTPNPNPAARVAPDHTAALLAELDAIARQESVWGFGLPLHHEAAVKRLRAAVGGYRLLTTVAALSEAN